jgi:hypothetical protein
LVLAVLLAVQAVQVLKGLIQFFQLSHQLAAVSVQVERLRL